MVTFNFPVKVLTQHRNKYSTHIKKLDLLSGNGYTILQEHKYYNKTVIQHLYKDKQA